MASPLPGSSCLKRGAAPDAAPPQPAGHRPRRPRRVRIRCPRCQFEPRREDLWMCRCFHLWHTFDTGGVCPGCHYAWKETQCPRCHQWSPHEAWYVAEDEGA